MMVDLDPRHCFDRPSRRAAPSSSPEVDDEAAVRDRGEVLVCRRCRTPITNRGAAIEVSDQHEHYFVNPHGYDFRIGCFAVAPGCVAHGATTSEFTWFPGHTWQHASCRGCTQHLGWLFRSPRQQFFGLVLDRLVATDESDDPTE